MSSSRPDLSLLLKHYSALTPSTPLLIPSPFPFPSSKNLSLPSTQQWIVQNLLPIDQGDKQGGIGERRSRGWKRGFWKRVVKGIEEGFEERRKEEGEESVLDEEVDSEILERMVEYLSTNVSHGPIEGQGENALSERKYYWGDLGLKREEWKCVRTREDGRMISGGTTGLRTWQACIALSNHFIADPSTIQEARNIVELGAGVGLLSLVAATLREEAENGAGKIVTTDVEENVLKLLDANVRLNGLDSQVKTSKLDWELASKLESHKEELFEWEAQMFGGSDERADLIIGADIVYDPALTALLASTLAWLLRPRIGEVEGSPVQAIIAGTIRNESTWELFLSECRSRKLRIEDVELKRLEDGSGIVGAEGWEGEGVVRVVRLTRGSSS